MFASRFQFLGFCIGAGFALTTPLSKINDSRDVHRCVNLSFMLMGLHFVATFALWVEFAEPRDIEAEMTTARIAKLLQERLGDKGVGVKKLGDGVVGLSLDKSKLMAADNEEGPTEQKSG